MRLKFQMLKIHFSILFIIFLQGHRGGEVDETFRELYVVPDVVDIPPAKPLNVSFTNGDNTLVLRCGQILPKEFLEVKPKVSWPPWSRKYYYTLYMTGITKWFIHIDRTGIENFTGTTRYSFGREWRRWIVVNIPGNDVSKGDTVFDYRPPANPAQMELTDRYVLLVYEQGYDKIQIDPLDRDNEITTTTPTTPTYFPTTTYKHIPFSMTKDFFKEKITVNPTVRYRINKYVKVNEFAKKYKLGNPKFGNCFLSKWVIGTTEKDGYGPFPRPDDD